MQPNGLAGLIARAGARAEAPDPMRFLVRLPKTRKNQRIERRSERAFRENWVRARRTPLARPIAPSRWVLNGQGRSGRCPEAVVRDWSRPRGLELGRAA